ncbi:MAG: hypothetical protein KDI49_09195, partial [Gammaproteobacteria bacterium]|nr:hypothetical protein [Gammaproteobacteria bacterium]
PQLSGDSFTFSAQAIPTTPSQETMIRHSSNVGLLWFFAYTMDISNMGNNTDRALRQDVIEPFIYHAVFAVNNNFQPWR